MGGRPIMVDRVPLWSGDLHSSWGTIVVAGGAHCGQGAILVSGGI